MSEETFATFGDFSKLDIKIGEIKTVEKVPDTGRLLRLEVDMGDPELRQIVSGIAEYYEDINKLIGVRCAFVANLEPKTIRGLESNGMLLAVTTESGEFSLLVPEPTAPVGSSAR